MVLGQVTREAGATDKAGSLGKKVGQGRGLRCGGNSHGQFEDKWS